MEALSNLAHLGLGIIVSVIPQTITLLVGLFVAQIARSPRGTPAGWAGGRAC